VIRSRRAILLIILLIGPLAVAQNAAQSVRLRLFLPPNVPSEKVEIRYVLYGAFGANGNFINPKPESSSVVIPLAVHGKAAEEIKAFAWAPGCRIQKLDIKIEGADVEQAYSCEPLQAIMLGGHIQKSRIFRSEGNEINVDYLAGWACEFFGFSDCMVPQFSVATTTVEAAGHFEIELPDFASDPACLGSASPSTFHLTLREVRSMNHVASLNPESKDLRAPGGGLKPASVYPHDAMFIASESR
jgi:hypothetical protein